MTPSSASASPNTVLSQVLLNYSHPEKVHISDVPAVEQLIEVVRTDGPNRLQVISDFDMTLTRYHENGVKCHSCHGILDYSPLMPEDFKQKNDQLRHVYYPIEIDHARSIEEKIPLMMEWYRQSHTNLVATSINKSLLKDIIAQSRAIFRDEVPHLIKLLHKADVPLLIFSAGIGDMVQAVLEKYELTYDNIQIISNYMIFDDNGKLIGFKEPLIHMYNKNETHTHNAHTEYFDQLANRHNAILLGDSLGDAQMSAGVSNKGKVLKIGFLNDKIPERLESFKNAFDVVLVDDQSMEFVNLLLGVLL